MKGYHEPSPDPDDHEGLWADAWVEVFERMRGWPLDQRIYFLETRVRAALGALERYTSSEVAAMAAYAVGDLFATRGTQ
jgi:hypothetical protein